MSDADSRNYHPNDLLIRQQGGLFLEMPKSGLNRVFSVEDGLGRGKR